MLFSIQNTLAWRIKPSVRSTGDQWERWHRALKKDLGISKAAIIFIKLWEKQGNGTASTRALRKYLEGEGITIQENAWDKVEDTLGGIGDFIGGVFNFGKVTAIVVGVIAVAGTGLLVYNLAQSIGKNPERLIPKK